MKSAHSASTACLALVSLAGVAAAAPPNDVCADAITLIPGRSVQGSTLLANSTGPDSAACAPIGADVWFKYTHAIGGVAENLTVDSCGAATSFDTVMMAFSGSCDSLIYVSCNDDSCGFRSSISMVVQPGSTYYIRLGGFSGESGNYDVATSLSAVVPPDPDIIVGDVSDAMYFGRVGGIRAYSLGTTSCNIGTTDALWVASNNQHPVIGQNIYRIENGRLELIGLSWLKHGFTALTENLCNTCNGHGGAVLGVGCSDPYVASLNGDQGRLGPRSHVNATNGYYPYPFVNGGTYTLPAGYTNPPAAAATIGRRLQVAETDLFHAGATYVAECQYVTADDAMANHGTNNMSYRITPIPTIIVPGGFALGGTTVRQRPAVEAWKAVDPGVVVQTYTYDDAGVLCKIWVGAKVIANSNNTWTYNYAVYNANSDRSFGSFELPSTNTTATLPYQRLPKYHSGEVVSMNDPWIHAASASGISWTVPQTFAANPKSSAIRWSTTATFSITTNTPPVTGTARLGFYKTAGSVDATNLPIPSNGVPPCRADFNGDGVLDFFDYLDFVAAFSSTNISADFNGDTIVDFFDYLDFVQAFADGC